MNIWSEQGPLLGDWDIYYKHYMVSECICLFGKCTCYPDIMKIIVISGVQAQWPHTLKPIFH